MAASIPLPWLQQNTGFNKATGFNPSTTGFNTGTSISNPTSMQESSANKNTERTTNTSGTKTSNRFGTEQSQQVRDLQNVTDPVLKAMNDAIAGANNQQTLNATDDTRRKNMEAIMAAIQGFDANAIQQGARGDVDRLSRDLMEDVLPQVTGAVEASGSSNNALGALLAQDAASRTGEAQARVEEQARANAQQEFLAMIQQATGASSGGSAVADNLANLMNISKGMVEQGTVNENKTFNENETVISNQQERMQEGVQSVGSQTGFDANAASASTAADSAAAEQSRLAKFALLQSSLSPFQTLQDMTQPIVGGGVGGAARQNSQNSINSLATMLGL